LSIDPLAELEQTQEQLRDRLLELAPVESGDLREAWEATARGCLETKPPDKPELTSIPEQHLVLVTCRDERHQIELLDRFRRDGLECRALLS
jgi:hypothetical protein